MKRTLFLLAVAVAGVVAFVAVQTTAAPPNSFRARITGYQEVPSVSTTALGEFRATLSADETTLTYTMEFNNLQGSVLFSHIHFAARSSNGGIMTFLCGGGTKPACPQNGTVTGTIMAADITGSAGAGLNAQGIAPGEFAEFVKALRSGNTYVNIHSNLFPGGELRGQISTDDN